MELKAWFGANAGLDLPAEIDLPVMPALAPYDAQIAALSRQVGAVLPRQAMRDVSGASQMNRHAAVEPAWCVDAAGGAAIDGSEPHAGADP